MEENSHNKGSPGMASLRIVIIGGGFAGVKCAKILRRGLSHKGLDIVLFNRENHMVFQPLLAEVVGASINPDAIAAPLRQMLPGYTAEQRRFRKSPSRTALSNTRAMMVSCAKCTTTM